jgi:hypothetical protein
LFPRCGKSGNTELSWVLKKGHRIMKCNNTPRTTVMLTGFMALGFAGALAVPSRAQTLLSANFYGGAEGDLVATALTVGAGGVYLAGNSQNTIESWYAEAALTPGSSSSPIWSGFWPGGSTHTGETFEGVTVTPTGVCYVGSSYQETTDNIGGKEPKPILVDFPLTGPTGPQVGGAEWVGKPEFFPSYQGGENLLAATTKVEASHSYIYASGVGQANFYNDTAVLIKSDAAGNPIWQLNLGDTSPNRGGDGAGVASLNGFTYVAGAQTDLSASSSQAMLWKVSPSGSVVWSVAYTGDDGAAANAIATAGHGIYVTGVLYSGASGGQDIFVSRYDEQGNLI